MTPSIRPTIAIILAFNEELHIARSVQSAFRLADRVYVIDSLSTDGTVRIAESLGATVLSNAWTTHAGQFNWALSQLPDDTGWVVRIDADEYVDDVLVADFHRKRRGDDNGLTFDREIHFCGSRIQFGGLFPVPIVRAFRFGMGRCEQRLMDEHIIVDGSTARVDGLLIDQNLNSLDWWIEKHNRYASLEATETLNAKHGFLDRPDVIQSGHLGKSAKIKRWLKYSVYLNLPAGARARLYYIYRAYFRLGIFGSREERMFHVLQGYWYRYLVDAKIWDVERYARLNGCDIREAVSKVLRVNFK